MISRKYSFQTLTQFSQENIVLNVALTKIDGILWRDMYISLTKLNRHI
jgi:hypothetical protein